MTEKKTVGVLFSRSPFEDYKTSERLRMSVGLTLGKNSVQVFFSGDGVYSLLKTNAEKVGLLPLEKHIQTLGMLKCRIIVNEESLTERDIAPNAITYGVETISREKFLGSLTECEVLINA